MDQTSEQDSVVNTVEKIVFMENISSAEYFMPEGGQPQRVLEDISLLVKKGESWGINGRNLFEIKLLLEIMANIRPYDGGRCILAERGMLRRKRTILKHVFYIGSSEMLYGNMNVLEFLMFCTARLNVEKVLLQERIFEFILDIGLGAISLTPIRTLTKEEKSVIILIAASYSDSMMVVFNFPEYDFDEILTEAIAKISDTITSGGKTLILGTQNNTLIEKACSHTGFIADGRMIYKDTVDNLRYNFDKVAVILRDRDIHGMQDKLAALLPQYRLWLKNDCLMMGGDNEAENDPAILYKKIADAGLIPDHMEINPKTVQNAYEELVLQHDLQE